jgi:hypothetical protein
MQLSIAPNVRIHLCGKTTSGSGDEWEDSSTFGGSENYEEEEDAYIHEMMDRLELEEQVYDRDVIAEAAPVRTRSGRVLTQIHKA